MCILEAAQYLDMHALVQHIASMVYTWDEIGRMNRETQGLSVATVEHIVQGTPAYKGRAVGALTESQQAYRQQQRKVLHLWSSSCYGSPDAGAGISRGT